MQKYGYFAKNRLFSGINFKRQLKAKVSEGLKITEFTIHTPIEQEPRHKISIEKQQLIKILEKRIKIFAQFEKALYLCIR